MVKGLDVFRDFFGGNADQFVLIGGTAATLAMQIPGTTNEILARIARAYGLGEPES